MSAIIKCCRFCVAPKRYPGCHSTCPEYLKERAEYDERKAEADRIKAAQSAIYGARTAKVIKANKRKRTGGA